MLLDSSTTFQTVPLHPILGYCSWFWNLPSVTSHVTQCHGAIQGVSRSRTLLSLIHDERIFEKVLQTLDSRGYKSQNHWPFRSQTTHKSHSNLLALHRLTKLMSVYFYEPSYNWDRFFDEAFSPRYTHGAQGQGPSQAVTESSDPTRFLKPKMDLHEDKEQNIVTATFEFPGLKKEDVQIDMQNGRLTVAAETKLSQDQEHEGYAVRERRFGKFSRTLQLPQGVKGEDIKASMENGF
ncbi:hypothetical protein D9757_001078 [Collybiopsis confluens]|uniref:SHSP domain-containing protein n=1 Tax=Collybiopsis confluens TaxID=2823264 RepID=A0A8H5I0E7_9AGAR|nr:hypothetical protein D9757_001078 [Collybiopsis confluens]